MSLPKKIYYWGGATAQTPNVDVEIPDMRINNYGPTGYVDIPVDEDGIAPTHFMVVLSIDDPGVAVFNNGSAGPMYYVHNAPGIQNLFYGVFDSEGKRYSQLIAKGLPLLTFQGIIPPGVDQVRLVNPVATDPGAAVPGHMKVWFYTTAR